MVLFFPSHYLPSEFLLLRLLSGLKKASTPCGAFNHPASLDSIHHGISHTFALLGGDQLER